MVITANVFVIINMMHGKILTFLFFGLTANYTSKAEESTHPFLEFPVELWTVRLK